MKLSIHNQKEKNILSGFTLIELIVVIAVLGILSTVVIVAVNPTEQLSRGRDSSRKAAISQLGRSIFNYVTVKGAYPVQGTTWMTQLTASQDIKALPKNPTTVSASYTGCTTYATYGHTGYGYCYRNNGTDVLVFAIQESLADKGKCLSTDTTWYVWSSFNGRAGIVCTATTADPVPGTQVFKD